MGDEYSGFLQVDQNGHIWWRLEDAFKLAAGYRAARGGEGNRPSALRTSSSRVRADARALLDAFHGRQSSIVPPVVLERDDGQFVDASAFLDWVSKCILLGKVEIPFPTELTRSVGHALNCSGSSASPGARFESLIAAIAKRFDWPLAKLPAKLRQRVERNFVPFSWDHLDPEQRRSRAEQWDYQHDPATEVERKFWFEFVFKKNDIEQQIETWRNVAAPTAVDLATKEERLAELGKALARMDRQLRAGRGDDLPAKLPAGSANRADVEATRDSAGYVAFPKAMSLLSERLNATPDELAAWVWAGPNDGGLVAYLNANELDPPPRFYYGSCNPGEFDYLSPLMACWFREDDIARFAPTDRYITGKTLIERWSEQLGIHAEAFIRAKIAESRLLDAHPICGGTQGTCPDDATWPPLASGLFVLSHVKMIEAEDFDAPRAANPSQGTLRAEATAIEIKQRFLVFADAARNLDWWADTMQAARRNGLCRCRVGEGVRGPGGSMWRPDLVAGWLVDRHKKGRRGLDSNAARSALKKFPGYEVVADDHFPPDED